MLKGVIPSLVVGAMILAGSIVIAVVIHPARVRCSYVGGFPPPPCPQPGTPLVVRIGVVGAGLVVAVLVFVVGRLWMRRKVPSALK